MRDAEAGIVQLHPPPVSARHLRSPLSARLTVATALIVTPFVVIM